jgi:YebC/PmpR family DNA-binding regulatory protein
MGRQWLQAKREVANLKKGQVVGKLVKEMMVAAKLGGPDPDGNPRLFAAVEKARRASVTRDVIERAIKKGAGVGDDKLIMEHIVFEGYAPHKVPVVVEVLTDNNNRTAADVRMLFKKGQLGASGSNKFLFDHVGLIEAHHADPNVDIEAAAIEAGAQNVEPLTDGEDLPEGRTGATFITERADLHAVSQWLTQNGWSVTTSEIAYMAKNSVDVPESTARKWRISSTRSTSTTTCTASGQLSSKRTIRRFRRRPGAESRPTRRYSSRRRCFASSLSAEVLRSH